MSQTEDTKPNQHEANRKPVEFRYDLIEPEFLAALALLMHDGARYDEEAGTEKQWRNGLPGGKSGINHALKHLNEYQGFKTHDKFGQRKYHLAAAAVNLMFEFWFESRRENEALRNLAQMISDLRDIQRGQEDPVPDTDPTPTPEDQEPGEPPALNPEVVPAEEGFNILNILKNWGKGASRR